MDGYTKPPPGRTIKWGHPHAHGVKLMLPMNELDGVLLNDLSPVRNNATMVGGASWSGGMVVLDGTDGEITLRRLSGLTDWTVHKRFTPDDVTSISRTLLDQGDILIAQIDDDIIYGATSNLEIDYISTVSACLTAGQPVNIFVKRSGTTMTCYVYDAAGKLYTDSFTVSGTAKTSLSNLILGSQSRTAFVYPAFTAANLTGEKALLISAADDVRFPIGSPSLNSDEITECFNNTQMTISINIESLNFVPGDGITHYLLDNRGTDYNTNNCYIYINPVGIINFVIWDKDSTIHYALHDITDWTIDSPHQVIAIIDFQSDLMLLYIDGSLVGSDVSLSFDSIDAIESVIHYSSDSSASQQLNGAATIQIWDVAKDSVWIGEEWAAGLGRKFVVTPNTILMARFSEENTGIVYWHKGMSVTASDSGGDLTIDISGVDTRFAPGDAVSFQDATGFKASGEVFVNTATGSTVNVHSGTAFADLDGDSQYFYRTDADFPESGITGANDFTIQFKIKQDVLIAGLYIVSKYAVGGNKRMYAVTTYTNGEFSILISTDGTALVFKNTSIMDTVVGEWCDIAVVYDASAGTADWYKNGYFVEQSTSLPNTIADKDPDFIIGAKSSGTSFVDGGIFNIALFDDKRTSAEILASAQDWDIDLSAEGNLIGQWMFNEAADAAAIDNTQGDAGRDLIPYDDGDVTFSGLRSTVGGYVQDVERIGVAVDFAGIYDALAANNTVHDVTTEDIAFFAWVKLNPDISINDYIFDKNLKDPGSYAFYIATGNVAVLFFEDDGGDSYSIRGNTDLLDGRVHFIAGIIDRDNAANCKIYVDGYEDGVTNKTGTLADTVGTLTNTAIMTFGSYSNHGFKFDGYIYGAGICYGADLMAVGEIGEAGAILTLATNPHNTAAWCETEDIWLLDENTGLTLNGNVNNLTLSSSLAWSLEAFVTKDHLLTVENGGIGDVGNIDSTWTVTKDTVVRFMDSRSLKGVCVAGDDGDEFTIWNPTCVTDENYFQTIRVWVPDIHDDTTLHLDVDGAATPILSREIGKSLGDNGHFARDFNLDRTYWAQAANNGIHDIGLQDIGIWVWVKADDYSGHPFIIGKNQAGGGAYYIKYFGDSGLVQFQMGDGTDIYSLSANVNDIRGDYHFIVIIIDRNNPVNCKLNIDGVDVATTKSGILGDIGNITNTGIMSIGRTSTGGIMTGQIAEVGIAYPADIMAAGEMGEAGAILAMYNNPSDLTQYPEFEDLWLCNDNTNSTVVVGAVNNLIASANTEDFAEKHWKMYNFCWKADQQAIEVNLSVTGAGAGANALEVNVDAGQLRVNLIENGGMEGVYDDESGGGAGTVNVAPGWDSVNVETDGTDTLDENLVDFHSGAKAQEIDTNTANEGIFQSKNLTIGDNYTLSVWVKVISGSMTVQVLQWSPVFNLDVITVGVGDWVNVKSTFVPGGTGEIRFRFRGIANFLVDDVSLIKNDTAPSTATRIRNFADGKLDGAVVWDRALSQNDIEAIRRQPYGMIK